MKIIGMKVIEMSIEFECMMIDYLMNGERLEIQKNKTDKI